jgi:chorismate-pyruvate lyase
VAPAWVRSRLVRAEEEPSSSGREAHHGGCYDGSIQASSSNHAPVTALPDSDGEPVFDWNSAQLLQRILLTNDGTLTDTLESAFLEPIDLVRLDIRLTQAPAAVPVLEIEAGDAVMERKILLRGQRSGVNYAYAESLLAVDRLDSVFRDQLIHSNMPLGRLWLENRLETWKQRLTIFRRAVPELAGYFGIDAQVELLGRSYRVFNNRRPIILITEYFPQQYS